MTVLVAAAWIVGIALLLACLFLALEVVAAVWPDFARKDLIRDGAALRDETAACIVIPAHNESGGVETTIANIKSQMGPADRVLVIADNCDDATADIARRAGAECLERTDRKRRGKGYALQFAIDAMRAAPPHVVCFVDADCLFEPGALDRIVGAARAAGRPAQALYIMQAHDGTSRQAVAAFAWLFINRVRMLLVTPVLFWPDSSFALIALRWGSNRWRRQS